MTKHLAEDVRREQILDAARTAFVSKGYAAARMEDIADTASLSKGGVYFHFRSKRDILEALVRREFTHVMGTMERLTRDDRPLAERIRRVARYFVDYFKSRPESAAFALLVSEMAIRDESLRALLHEMNALYHERLTRLVQTGVDVGAFRSDIDTASIATALKAMMDGVEALIAVGIEVDLDQLMSSGFDMIFRGIRAQGMD